jgi:hypothetical protein
VTSDPAVPPLHVRAMGVTVEIAVPDQPTRDRLAHQWSRAVVAAPDEPAAEHTTAQPGPPDTEASRDYRLTTQVTMAALRATAGLRINLHAGGVADEGRRVLAVVGPSGTGKTTATLALAHRLGYVSDETVSIAPDGTIAPHPKPLSVIVDEERRRHKEQHSPDDLGLLPTPEEGRLARLVLLHRGAEGKRGLARLDTAEGMLQLIEQSSSLAQLPRPLHALLTLIEGCGGLWALTYDEISDHVDELVDLLAGTPAHHESRSEPGPTWHAGEPTFPLLMDANGPLLARMPWAEAVEVDDRLIVLTESRALLLADLTATVWLHLARPCSMEELVRAAQHAHGAHSDAQAIVGEAVTTLVEESLAARGSLA